MEGSLKNILVGVLVLLLSSCCKAIIEDETVFENTSNDRLELRFFTNDKFVSQIVEAKSKAQRSFFIIRGVRNMEDSAQVFTNGMLTQVHYNHHISKVTTDPKVLLYQTSKNLLNSDNYKITTESLSCNGRRSVYLYQF